MDTTTVTAPNTIREPLGVPVSAPVGVPDAPTKRRRRRMNASSPQTFYKVRVVTDTVYIFAAATSPEAQSLGRQAADGLRPAIRAAKFSTGKTTVSDPEIFTF